MWRYTQSTGALDHDGVPVGVGYSGHGPGVNNPVLQAVHDVGPIPCGLWHIGAPIDTTTHGPFVLPLTPMEGTETFGRSGFLMHGDEVAHAGEQLASLGCIILARAIREQVAASGDDVLEVVPG